MTERKKIWTVPNVLSMIRLLMVGVFVWAFFNVSHVTAGFIALAAALTDVADGFIARRFNLVTDFGRIIDPLADKLLQAAVCICIGYAYDLIIIPLVFLAKEFCMLLGGYLIIRAGRVVPPSRWWGKLGTLCFFICSLAVLFFCTPQNKLPAIILLSSAALVMLAAFCAYFKVFFELNLSKKQDETTREENE